MDRNNSVNAGYCSYLSNIFIMTKYSAWIGLWKTFKNSLVLLGPFLLALLAGVPAEYGWIVSPIAYYIKNWIENR